MEVQRLGKYELRGLRGRGAMGTVHEGWDSVLRRRVAIKTVPLPDATDPEAQEQLARFRREAQAAGMLNHPHVVAVHDYGETAEVAFIVMEFVDGDPLKARLDRGERIAPEAIRVLMAQLLDGLGFSHRQGVVHRDIKPGNIMLTRQGAVKITDFGIARIESSSMTQSGTLLGTPAYMSPEQFMGHASDARTDIYSAGAVFYQLLTGRRPFEGATTAIMHKVLSTPPPRPSAFSPVLAAFDPVVARAMAKDPAQRYASAAELAVAIESAFARSAAAMPDPEATLLVGGIEAAEPMNPVHAAPEDDTTLWQSAPTANTERAGFLLAGAAIAAALLGFLGWYLLWPDAAVRPGPALAPVVQAPLPQPAPRPPPDLAALRAAVAPVECTLSNPQIGRDGTIFISGLSRRGRPEAALRQAIGTLTRDSRVAWSLTGFDGPYCEALNVLRPLRARDLRESAALAVTLKGESTRLRQGDRAALRIVLPEFAAHLRVDYLSGDGSIVHLLTDDGTDLLALAKGGMMRVGASHRYNPGETIVIGEPDPAIGFDGWEIDAPFGTDMIVVIASSAPLRRTAPPSDDSAAVYFHDLRAALDAAELAGVAVSAQAVLLETVPR